MSPGEKSEGASELHRMGYELELYPSTADLPPSGMHGKRKVHPTWDGPRRLRNVRTSVL